MLSTSAAVPCAATSSALAEGRRSYRSWQMAAPPLKKPRPRTSPRQPWRRATQPKKLRMWQARKDVKWIIVNSEPGHLLWRAPYFMEQNRGGRRGLTFLDADKSARRSRGGAICTLSHSWVNIVQRDFFFFFFNSLLSKSARKAC